MAIEENPEQFLLVLLVVLSIAILPRVPIWLRRSPYPLLLVIVGLGLAEEQALQTVKKRSRSSEF
ncbi:hypothetical protein [Chamaesiphon sp.]|uniref:hypothetical protein n=1 Tax=Chamaesiphon sp. TaxID=2814140 RepID=UPI003593A63C